MSVKNKLINTLNYLKDLKNNKKNKFYELNKQPVFLISTNRSGASLLSSILRQHPDVMSLSDQALNKSTYSTKGHTAGFAEDFIWHGLDDRNSDHNNFKKEGFVWGHPKYLSKFYKENYQFKNSLVNEIFKFKTEKTILIKHPFFSLRLKLIKKMFPNSKIILNIRSYKDFIISNNHKLKNSIYKKAFINNSPDLGLHWLIINTVAMYQLKKFFPRNYLIFSHEKFYDENYNNQELMNKITNFLNINKFAFSFEKVNIKYKYSKKIHYEYDKIPSIAEEIAEFEKNIYDETK